MVSIEEILTDSGRATADMAVDIISGKPELFEEAYVLCMKQEGRMIRIYPELAGEFIAALQLLIDSGPETLARYSKKKLREIQRGVIP